ncbi:MAG: 23S rRNA (uracil(1939)-C(5))-methyltransferase RlmD, partial [Thermodesulfobacteriota bacterium]
AWVAFHKKEEKPFLLRKRPARGRFLARSRPRVQQETERQLDGERRPPCPHSPACYGCPLIRLPYPQQLAEKRGRVAQAFAAYPTLQQVDVPPTLASPRRFGYRTRVKLAVRRVEGKVLIGLYIPESHQVADISGCPVHPRQINEVVQFLKQAIDRLGIIPYDEARDTGQLRYIDLRYSFWQRKVLLTLVTRHMDFPQIRDLVRQLERRFPFLGGIVQNINDKPGNVIWGERFHPIRGRDSVIERVGHLLLDSPVDTFTQVNPPVARKLYETVLEWAGLTGEEIAVDLYCGIGPIALYLASRAKLVVGIDENVRAVNTAKENARRNGYHNCRFFAGDAAEKVKEVVATLSHIDLCVVNPPRKGLSPEAFGTLGAMRPPRLVYVSCDPATLARDLDRFCQGGYTLRRVQPLDMFPQTDQVETVALLTTGEGGRP